MNKELELWQFVAERLARDEPVMLLVVAESSGSSPGRRGYKMAIGSDGELIGSIGGGVMEVNLVEQSRSVLREAGTSGHGDSGSSSIVEQVHRKDAPNASGMICSGKQTVIFKLITPAEAGTVDSVIGALTERRRESLTITPTSFSIDADRVEDIPESTFSYNERLGYDNDLYIIGGGHCALALSELMSKMDFHISLFDDRPQLNTIEKNEFAHEVTIIDDYDRISDHVPSSGDRSYVVVMTLGYKSDEEVIRALLDREFKYFGVLGSNAKMATMFKGLIREGIPAEKLERIRTPVGIPIHSRTPEEIAVSIAAEIISVKNST